MMEQEACANVDPPRVGKQYGIWSLGVNQYRQLKYPGPMAMVRHMISPEKNQHSPIHFVV